MQGDKWQVHIKGHVTRLTENGMRVAAAKGEYTMTSLDLDTYELTREGVPTFSLTLKEVSHYINERALKPLTPFK